MMKSMKYLTIAMVLMGSTVAFANNSQKVASTTSTADASLKACPSSPSLSSFPCLVGSGDKVAVTNGWNCKSSDGKFAINGLPLKIVMPKGGSYGVGDAGISLSNPGKSDITLDCTQPKARN